MNGFKKLLVILGCLLLVAVGWLAAVFSKSDVEKQRELVAKAQSYLDDEIYVKAAGLLEEAIGFNTKETIAAEEKLKEAYIPLLEKSGYSRKYTNLLAKQMARSDAAPEVFKEASEYYLSRSKQALALDALKDGIKKTQNEDLISFYEENRYEFETGRATYGEVTEFLNGYIQVAENGKWGLSRPDGGLVLPFEYDFLSTYYDGQLIAKKDGFLMGVDLEGNRTALYKDGAFGEITNYNEGRLSVEKDGSFVLATPELSTGSVTFEEIGTFSDGGACAKQNGKWGVVSRNGKDWIIEPGYDEIICDELGRCYYKDSVFVKNGDRVQLLVEGNAIGESYEDARPFAGELAAVKKDGKWGFIDMEGNLKIDFMFDDAKSFSTHLAAVKKGSNWGYVSLKGEMAIEPIFMEAKSFYKGTAPVKTIDGWQFITLLEYKTKSTGI